MTALPPPTPQSEAEQVLRTFLDSDGRISQLPAKQSKRRVILDYVAQRFEIGRSYPEPEVNAILKEVFDDHAALRRYLVENDFLERDHGIYWRSGGTVEL